MTNTRKNQIKWGEERHDNQKGLYVRRENKVALGSPRTRVEGCILECAYNYLAPISSSAQPGSEFSF